MKVRFVEINRRQLAVRFVAEDVVWFDFDVICGAGRAASDYIEIAKIYPQWSLPACRTLALLATN